MSAFRLVLFSDDIAVNCPDLSRVR